MNKENIKKLIFQVISDSGDDSTRDGLKGTPERVSKLYEELLSGYGKDINELVKNSLFKTTLDDMIVVKNIEFSSTCEHEMTPFFGMVNLGYIPNGNISYSNLNSGINKDVNSHRHFYELTTQERRLRSGTDDNIINVSTSRDILNHSRVSSFHKKYLE